MDDQVRIAANGRSKVRIGFCGEGEMTLVALAVAGLFEGTQHEIAEYPLLRLSGDFGDQTLVVARGNMKILARQDDVFSHLASITALLRDRKSLDRNCTDPQRIAEVRCNFLELNDSPGL